MVRNLSGALRGQFVCAEDLLEIALRRCAAYSDGAR
jgi:hypothetical protein